MALIDNVELCNKFAYHIMTYRDNFGVFGQLAYHDLP